ncbi:MAG: bile acid:sodium symporter [Nanobdellota archaeon]
MWTKLNVIKQNLVWFVAAFMLLGLVNGYLFPGEYLKPLIIPLTILMVYPMMVSMDMKAVFSRCSYRLQLATQLINFVFIPLFAFGLGRLFFPEQQYFAFGLLLLALLPTSGMTISWTGFAKGNAQVAVKMTIIGLIAGVLIAPVYAWLLMGTMISIPLAGIMRQISLIIIIPLTLGVLTQFMLKRYIGEARFNKDMKRNFPLLSLLGVIGIIFVAMSLKAQQIIQEPWVLIQLLIPLLLFYGVNYAITSFIGKVFFKREDAIALVYGTVMRNLSVALAIAMTVFENGSDMALIMSVAYILQIKSAAWYVKLNERIFGAAPESKAKDLMQEGIFALQKDRALQDATRLLDEEHIHSVAVLDKEKPLGILTSHRVINLLAEGASRSTRLSQLALEPLLKVKAAASIHKVIKTMKRNHSYKVLVMKNNKPVGVLTESDILRDEK